MRSVMKHSFSNAPTIDAPRSVFDLSCGHKTTFDAGNLIPIYIADVLPGDTFNLNMTLFGRISNPSFPIMDNIQIDVHHFFVPLRLVWDNARKFFGEQVNPADSIDYTIPQFSSFTPTEGSLSDYMGLPIGNAMTVNSIYHRGYNLIWNEWFRDQNLQDSVVVDTDDGPDTITDYVLLKRGKRHDYFTSALPWPQKGDAVSLPLGTYAPVISDGSQLLLDEDGAGTNSTPFRRASTGTNAALQAVNAGTITNMFFGDQGLQADLTSATASTINDLREAFQVQKLLERDARSGTRYSELVKNHFGCDFYDVSYRPEFLGSSTTPLNMQSMQTAVYNGPLGETTTGLTGLGTFSQVNQGFSKSFVEHGFIMSLVSARADLTYQQGIPKHFLKQTRYDIYWPSLAHLGEQEVMNSELYYTNTATDDDVFGYQERYAEYRFSPSRISSTFRSTAATPLDAWHLSQEFTSLPTLGPTFIQEDPPIDRIKTYDTEPDFILDSYTSVRAARPMPVFGVPGMIDHF